MTVQVCLPEVCAAGTIGGALFVNKWTLALLVERLRTKMPPFAIEEVRLTQTAEGSEARFVELWGVPVRLGQERSGIRLARGVWEQPNVQADPLLHQALRTVAEQVEMKQIVDAPLVYAIRTHLPGALQAAPSPPRTLQRVCHRRHGTSEASTRNCQQPNPCHYPLLSPSVVVILPPS